MTEDFDFLIGEVKAAFTVGTHLFFLFPREPRRQFTPKDNHLFLRTPNGVTKVFMGGMGSPREEPLEHFFVDSEILEDSDYIPASTDELIGAEIWCKNVFKGKPRKEPD